MKNKLINEWCLLCEPPCFKFRYHATDLDLFMIREKIHQQELDSEAKVKKADLNLITTLLRKGKGLIEYFDEPMQYPQDHWWWHLDKIVEKSYPQELLPEYLRVVYEKALKGEIKLAYDSYQSELIKSWVLFCEFPDDLLYYASAPALLETREEIHQQGLDDEEDVQIADLMLIEVVLQKGADPSDLFDDPQKYPFDHWWWHLDKIGEKTYPAQLLPEYLRNIYLRNK
ncbi:hypothetical protein [Thermodesulfobacterium commune]|uniref:Uncharacterized protein n=1 Tax=Thermodesulfobacterium commune DSM 2178 TaxID=289377 RepID=A0A075WZT0_9BACT|nr:hypothetical protein [Thermodesulfobacterium commune]AIH04202.1 hypothetical protein HL41_05245 [Thermodesulfobacterium commune DSM 2178]